MCKPFKVAKTIKDPSSWRRQSIVLSWTQFIFFCFLILRIHVSKSVAINWANDARTRSANANLKATFNAAEGGLLWVGGHHSDDGERDHKCGNHEFCWWVFWGLPLRWTHHLSNQWSTWWPGSELPVSLITWLLKHCSAAGLSFNTSIEQEPCFPLLSHQPVPLLFNP